MNIKQSLFFLDKELNNLETINITDLQKAYYFGYKLNNKNNNHAHITTSIKIYNLDIDKLESSILNTINNHEILRTLIISEDKAKIFPKHNMFRINILKIRNASEFDSIFNEIHRAEINLEEELYFSFYLIECLDFYYLVFKCSLFFLDAGSINLLNSEIISRYKNEYQQKASKDVIEFKDFVNQVVNNKDKQNSIKYWRSHLKNKNIPRITTKCNYSKIDSPNFASNVYVIDKNIWEALKRKSNKYSLTAICLGAYALTLMKWSTNDDFIINLVSSYKSKGELGLGNYGNPTLIALEKKDTIKKYFFNIRNNLIQAIKHQESSILDLIDIFQEEGSQNNVIFPYVFTPIFFLEESFSLDKLDSSEFVKYRSYTVNVHIDCQIFEKRNSSAVVRWDYVEQLFDKDIISSMHKAYCDLIEYLAEADWESDLPEIELPELDKSVIDQANSYTQSEVECTLVDLFTSNLQSKLSSIAVIDDEGKYSYKVISEYTNTISLYLHDHGLCKAGKLIGVLSEKSYRQVAATLGIMQSGSGYLPLHVDWPRGRCDEVLSEGNVETVLLSRSEYNGCIKGSEIDDKYNWLIIEDIINYKSDTRLEELTKPGLDDIAYVVFTSGSTGKPKGVTISHRGAVNTIQAINDKFNVNKKDKVLALSELSFDLSVYDIFGLLAAGGTIVFPDQKKTKEPSHWYELIDKYQITIWDTVPQLMSLLVDYVRDSNKELPSLKVTLMSGDWIPLNLPKQIKEVCPNITVMSLGGATEGSIWSIWYGIKDIDDGWSSIPYGQAMPNQKMYILNEDGQHNPIGVIGEIHIGGQGVALGYWQDEEKTKASFIEHPELGRLYKTGDLGKWDRNGYIVFEGRKDGQVKLNGYRVELDEISSKLAKLPGIENALVTIQDNHLVGYLVSESFKEKEDGLDYQAFKLEQNGILKGLDATYQLIPTIDIDRYKLRKSYRKFNHKIDINNLDIQIEGKNKQREIPSTFTQDQLSELLSPLSGARLEDRVLPKYLYPSGGSAYAIRAFINIPKGYIEGLEEGLYYYHPTEYSLQYYKESNSKEFSIDFDLYIPAMEPLYKEETLRLAYIELGHIFSLLNEKYPLTYSLIDSQEEDYHKLVKVSLGNHNRDNNLNLRKINNKKNHFDDYDLNSQSIMFQNSELGKILSNSSGLLVFETDNNPESYIEAGYQAQYITTKLYDQDVGSTSLGINITDNSIYAIAIGGITQEDKDQSEVNVDQVSLGEFISNKLKNYLPRYMIPETYLTIDHLPLTANGKVSYKELPKAELIEQDNYVAPRNKLEEGLCNIFAEVLGLERVGITDDFFRIGGDSILSIRIVSKAKNLGVNISAADIFKCRTVLNLLSSADIEVKAEQIEYEKYSLLGKDSLEELF